MVKIIDCTLREGMQAPGVVFGQRSSSEIAYALRSVGVDMIECGHPFANLEEAARVVAVVKASAPIPVLAHARARKEDIDAVKAVGASWVGIFAGVNKRSVRHLIGEHNDVLGLVREAISYACSLGLKVRYTVEDGSRTSADELIEAFRVAVQAGAHRLCLADTVGILCPWEVEDLIVRIKRAFPNHELEAHFHDDRGMADANALSAVRAGVEWISTSVNGLGERAGISDTIVLLANLHKQGWRPMPEGLPIQDVSRLVQAHSRCFADRRRAVTGRMAFTHTARLHQRAFLRDPSTYSWTDPCSLGREGRVNSIQLPKSLLSLINTPKVISSEELRHHRRGPGDRYLFLDQRVVSDSRQYCIVRHVPKMEDYGSGHVDTHRHWVDSLFLFIGDKDGLSGLKAEVRLDDDIFVVDSPASVFIPAGITHSYRIMAGSGLFVNHVLEGEYNASLLDNFIADSGSFKEADDMSSSVSQSVAFRSSQITNSSLQDFIRDRLPASAVSPDTLVLSLFDSLTYLDFFIYLEGIYGDAISLDTVSSCKTFADLAALLEGMPVRLKAVA